MEMNVIDIKKDDGVEFIVGQGNFSIYTVDDLAKTKAYKSCRKR